jgi:hypothetical protein
MSEERAPRRIVLLEGDADDGPVAAVLKEYSGAEVSGTKLHSELPKQAAAHPGRVVAAEWHGPLGWTRFAWCRA